MSAGESILFRSLTLHSYLHATFLDLNIKLKWGTWVIKIIMLCTVYEKAPEGKSSLGSSASHLGPVKLGQCKEMPSKYQPKCQPVCMHAFMHVTCTRAHRKLAQKCLGAFQGKLSIELNLENYCEFAIYYFKKTGKKAQGYKTKQEWINSGNALYLGELFL